MKKLIYSVLLVAVLSVLIGCKAKTVYVPVESNDKSTEYIDRWYRDSIYIKDSIIINKAGDTILIEKHKTIYKDKLIRDSIFITDSIKISVPYPIVEIKEVNRLENWQIILMVLGGGAIGFIGYRIFRFFS